MKNSITTGTKEFTATHPRRAREKDNNHGFRRVFSAEVIDFQTISDDFVNGGRGFDEREDDALVDSSPGRCEGRTWIAQQNRQPRRVSLRLTYFAV